MADNQRRKKISIDLGGVVIELNKSRSNGHFGKTFSLTTAQAGRLPRKPGGGGWVSFTAITRKGDRRKFKGQVQFIGRAGVSVISDIDDTIKISNVLDKSDLLHNTFTRPFRAVAGLPAVYRNWARKGVAFHYLSGSPWQLYVPLVNFIKKNRYPMGSFHMKLFRLKDRSLVRFIRGRQIKYKMGVIESIMRAFPKRKFILVGDSGEKDPEVYAMAARKFPTRVIAIFIRDVRGNPKAPRFAKLFGGLGAAVKWKVFTSAAGIGGFNP